MWSAFDVEDCTRPGIGIRKGEGRMLHVFDSWGRYSGWLRRLRARKCSKVLIAIAGRLRVGMAKAVGQIYPQFSK